MALPTWLLESWVEYGIGALFILVRIFGRTYVVGFNGWQGDDFLIICVLAFNTGFLHNLTSINNNGSNISISEADVAAMSPLQVSKTERGSLHNLTGWLQYVLVIWCLKGCMLFFFSRLMNGLWLHKFVKAVGWIVGLTGIAMFFGVLFQARPVSRHWQVKPFPSYLPIQIANTYMVGITNFVTDGMIILIPIPLLWKVQLPWAKKIGVGILLCSGVFIMVATALRNALSIKDLTRTNGKDVGSVLSWCTRETFTAIVVVNIPCIKPLFSKLRQKKLSSSTSSSHLAATSAHGETSLEMMTPDGYESKESFRTEITQQPSFIVKKRTEVEVKQNEKDLESGENESRAWVHR